MWRCQVNKPSLLLIKSDDLGWSDLRAVVRSMCELNVIGEATDATEAIQMTDDLMPNLILAGMELNGESTLPLIGRLHTCSSRSRLVVCAGKITDDDIVPLIRAGVVLTLSWNDVSARSIYHCLAALAGSDLMIGSRAISQAFLTSHCPAFSQDDMSAVLSSAEYEITKLLASGMIPKEIAAQKHVVPQTIAEHLRRARHKLGARTNTQLVCRAVELGIIKPHR
jgi:DNA-binding NarL/FixJ family response regulator